MLFVIAATIAARCAFMLPVATPPNAIIYGSGKVTIPQMAKAGLWLNIIVSMLLILAVYTLFIYVFGIAIGVLPGWAQYVLCKPEMARQPGTAGGPAGWDGYV